MNTASKGGKAKACGNPIWEGVYPGFPEVPVVGSGFDGDTWITRSLQKMKAIRAEVSHNTPLPPPGNYREALLPILAALVYRETGRVRILDFGGGLGFAYFQIAYGLPEKDGLEYHIVERDAVCQAGRQFFSGVADDIYFHSKLPRMEGGVDIVHVGSSLHYIEDWKQMLKSLCALAAKYLFLVDVPAGNIPTFASAQNYHESKIPVWFLNIDELMLVVMSLGYDLMVKSTFQPNILGVEQSLPMKNFANKFRLNRTCNLLFAQG